MQKVPWLRRTGGSQQELFAKYVGIGVESSVRIVVGECAPWNAWGSIRRIVLFATVHDKGILIGGTSSNGDEQ